MKKLKEVCEIVGVTRRTLQEYDRIGLVRPTAKTDAGYWLYDEGTIQVLTLIQILVESGFSRNEIKGIIKNRPIIKPDTEYENALIRLKKKRRHIDGLIRTIEQMQHYSQGYLLLPEKVQKIADQALTRQMMSTEEGSILQRWRQDIEIAADDHPDFSENTINEDPDYQVTEEDRKLEKLLHAASYTIMLMKDMPADSWEVQETVAAVFDKAIEICWTDQQRQADLEEIAEIRKGFVESMIDSVEFMASDPKILELSSKTNGDTGRDFDFLKQALLIYLHNLDGTAR